MQVISWIKRLFGFPVMCQERIEYLRGQHACLAEFNRRVQLSDGSEQRLLDHMGRNWAGSPCVSEAFDEGYCAELRRLGEIYVKESNIG